MNDKEAAEYYNRPDAFRAGERVTPPSRKMSGHVPVRFPDATIQQIKQFAAEDGMSVSNWIRRAVDRELRHRARPYTGVGMFIEVHVPGLPRTTTRTADRAEVPSFPSLACR